MDDITLAVLAPIENARGLSYLMLHGPLSPARCKDYREACGFIMRAPNRITAFSSP
jgi:hypothetical protein